MAEERPHPGLAAEAAAPAHTTPIAASGTKGRARTTGYTRLNDIVGIYVAASAVLAAVPVALNLPYLWLAWVAMTAAVTIAYLAAGYREDPNRALLSGRHPWLFGLAVVIPLYALAQGLPGLGWLTRGPPVPEGMAPGQISLVPDASRMGALRFCGYILFALLAIEVASRASRARRMAWWIFWGVAIHATWALIALNLLGDINIWGAEKTAYLGAATGTFVNRNSFATFLAMGGILGLALLLEQIGKPVARKTRSRGVAITDHLDRIVIGAGLLLILIALVSTQSRMGLFAGLLGAATCVFWMRVRAGASPIWTAGALAGIGAILLGGAFVIYGQELVMRFLRVADAVVDRENGYRLILGMIADRPVFGFGFDTFRPGFELVHALPMNPDRYWDRAHSTYLSHWMELGIVVGSIPIVMGILVARRLWDTVWRRERDHAIGVAGLSILLTVAVHCTVDFSLEMPANAILLLAILGLGLAHRKSGRGHERPAGGA